MTEQELIRALVSIRGVKSATIDILGASLVKVNIRYRLWVYFIPGAQKRVSEKAQKFIDFVIPIGIQIEVVGSSPWA
jgi:hypothetical protein